MENSGKKKGLSGLFKNLSDKIHGKKVVKKVDTSMMSDEDFCKRVLLEIGGFDNILMADSCVTRLRLELKDSKKINSEKLEALGCEGVISVGENRVQLIFGEKAVMIEKYCNKLLKLKKETEKN